MTLTKKKTSVLLNTPLYYEIDGAIVRNMRIPTIDIFAGPGGLSEGFSSIDAPFSFETMLSIEKDSIASQTLLLRNFLHCFGNNGFPNEYYQYIRDPDFSKEALFEQYPDETNKAKKKTWQTELGNIDPEILHGRISKALGKNNPHWVLLGGPPCQAYSLVGRARMTGAGTSGDQLKGKKLEKFIEEKINRFYDDQRHTLYKEYLKIVAVHKPTVFVMENVKGILSSKTGRNNESPVFEQILQDLQDPWKAIKTDRDMSKDETLQKLQPEEPARYKLFSFVKNTETKNSDKTLLDCDRGLEPRDYIIRSEDYGIPQKRHRVIILGVLEDYDIQPKLLKKEDNPTTVKDALDELPKLRSGLSKGADSSENWTETVHKGYSSDTLSSLQDKAVAKEINTSIKALEQHNSRGGRFIKKSLKKGKGNYHNWIHDPKMGGVSLHETRGHMESDLWRYLFVSAHTKSKGYCPKVDEFPEWLLPDHKNVKNPLSQSKEQGKKKTIHFRDRFRVQNALEPATTVTCHISKDGHYYIHYDPSQCRSLTVREAARLQTFPDNYFFEGNRTQQYHQVGNAVPPLLANKMAYIVSDVIRQCHEVDKIKTNASKRRKEKAA